MMCLQLFSLRSLQYRNVMIDVKDNKIGLTSCSLKKVNLIECRTGILMVNLISFIIE